MERVIVVVKMEGSNEATWWTAEGKPMDSEPLRVIEPFPEELKGSWKEEFINFINDIAPQVVYFDSNGRTSSTSAKGRHIIF